ncbi:hypothetical protein AVEN_252301-1 [Araneus ventricosus]|uniref:Uncharacterized protein n=1 Tax=Araneus ventricosus TaxID=182803 RepID=A0A4Y2DR82_ARAVE|nr:hypothetical protein AVEN_252301-1 [Araneus ventricosus]
MRRSAYEKSERSFCVGRIRLERFYTREFLMGVDSLGNDPYRTTLFGIFREIPARYKLITSSFLLERSWVQTEEKRKLGNGILLDNNL